MKTYLLIVLTAAAIVVVALLLLVAGRSTGDSGPGKALGMFAVETARATSKPPVAPPPPPGLIPIYPGASVDGGTSEGTAEGAPPPDEPAVEEDDSTEVDDDGALANPEPLVQQAVVVEQSPVQPQDPVKDAPITPQVNRAGYCDGLNKFHDLAGDQETTDPEWIAKGPWRPADVDPETGAVFCKQSEEAKPSLSIIVFKVQPLAVVELELRQADGTTKCGQYVALRFYPDTGGQSFLGYRTTCTTTPLTLAKSGNVCPVIRVAQGLAPLNPPCIHVEKGKQMVTLK